MSGALWAELPGAIIIAREAGRLRWLTDRAVAPR